MNKHFRFCLVGTLLILSGFLILNAYHNYEVLQNKIDAQASVNDATSQWKKDYLLLNHSEKAWTTKYLSFEDVPDIYRLAQSLKINEYGLTHNIDDFRISKIENLKPNDIFIGLHSLCFNNDGASFSVQAPTTDALLAGVLKLTQRTDITMGTITLDFSHREPMAHIDDLCILIREAHE